MSPDEIDAIADTARALNEDPQSAIILAIDRRLEMAQAIFNHPVITDRIKQMEIASEAVWARDIDEIIRRRAINGQGIRDIIVDMVDRQFPLWKILDVIEFQYTRLVYDDEKDSLLSSLITPKEARKLIKYAAQDFIPDSKVDLACDRADYKRKNKVPDLSVADIAQSSGTRRLLEHALRARNTITPIRFGMPNVDQYRPEGLSVGQVLSLVASDGGMKTSMALHLIDPFLLSGGRVLFLSLDMNPRDIEVRRLMRAMNMSNVLVKEHVKNNTQEYRRAKEDLIPMDQNFVIRSGVMGTGAIEQSILSWMPDCVVIDYLTAIDGDKDLLRRVQDITKQIRAWRDRWGMTFILLSQTARLSKMAMSKGDTGSHALGGGEIERLVDWEVELKRITMQTIYDDSKKELVLSISKNRGGENNRHFVLHPNFPALTFDSMADEVDLDDSQAGAGKKPKFRSNWGKAKAS
jgi:KaiC/GvpD/RAD55 family RecA-like ATPase